MILFLCSIDIHERHALHLRTELYVTPSSWRRHQKETFSALLDLCAGNSPFTAEFPLQRSVMRSFDVFFDLRLNKRLSKQSLGWWFEKPSRPLWRHYNVIAEISTWLTDFILSIKWWFDFKQEIYLGRERPKYLWKVLNILLYKGTI